MKHVKHETQRRNCHQQKLIRRCGRIAGGNWQGTKYLSYAEHDACVRADMVGRQSLGWARGRGYTIAAKAIHENR